MPATYLGNRQREGSVDDKSDAAQDMQQGRPLELGDLYRLYAKSVARWAYLLGGPRIDPEDVMQEVFIVAHKQLPRLENQAHLSAWLYRVTANVVRNRRRKNHARDLIREALSFGASDESGPSPAEHAERQQTHALVYGILDQMKEKYRTVLIMFELEGMSGEEIAKTLEVKLPTLWVWLHRARQDFLARLQKSQEKVP
jgi:RNA polymerase sigma-70 factor (ECF subfamily)